MNIPPFFQELIHAPTPVLIDFFAEWCGPCKAMEPTLEQLKTELGDNLDIIAIDVDELTDLAVEMKVMGVPTLMLFQNGRLLWREAGTQTLPALKQIVETHTQVC
jgi:thioredoxin 1